MSTQTTRTKQANQATRTPSHSAISPERAMARALVLARRGMGAVHPNPPVGAVVVAGGRVVGEGYHRAPGQAHAEVDALAAAGEAARGATVYVTLDPCHHQGRTPPCTAALIAAGVAKVVIAHPDPNPVSGDGPAALEAAGITVERGLDRRRAAHLLAGFTAHVTRQRPRFVLKVATSLDGKLATAGGDSRWISSPVARAWVHRRRREADAILVGAETAVRDNPALTTRHVKGRSPVRVVADSTLRTPAAARVWKDDGVRRIAATTGRASAEARAALAERGVEVWELPADENGRVALRDLAARLHQADITQVLVEGGGTLAGALIGTRLADEVWMVVSRTVLLGGGGPGWTEGLRTQAVARAVKIARTSLREMGPDWCVRIVPEHAQWWDPETFDV